MPRADGVRVAILGAGAVAYGAAAFLATAGHEPVIWSVSGQRTRSLAAGAPLIASGAIEGTFRPAVAESCAAALAGAEVVLVALPAYAHRRVFDAVAPHLRSGQTVIVSGHLSFGALYLARQLVARGVDVPVVAWGTTLTTGRQLGFEEVRVGAVRARIDLATVPVAAAAHGLALCRNLFGARFMPRDDLLAIAVSNLNPQNHLGIVLGNLTRIELGQTWSQPAHTTDAVGRLIEALDAERLAIAAALGVEVRTVAEHFSLSFGVPAGPVGAMSRAMTAKGDATAGPASLDTRYVLEDVPYGLVPTARLGHLVGRPAVLHESGIHLIGAAWGRDFWHENELLDRIGFEALDLAELRRLCREGC